MYYHPKNIKENSMITVTLMGGLGNQMFQYAYARSLALDLNTDISFDISFFEKRKERDLSLLKFKLVPTIRFNKIPSKELNKGFFLDRFSRIHAAKTMLKKQFLFWPTMQPYPLDFRLDGKKDIKLYGYWQGASLIDHHKTEISKELRVMSELSSDDEKLISKMQNENSVCVHIRRGDYVSCDWLVCDKEYYETASRMLAEKLKKPTFYIFSDDPDWVKGNIHFPEGNEIIYADDGKHMDYEIMRLMYSCNHFIISNSTFSWWAQYLTKNEDKIVIAPKRWMNDDLNYDFMYSDDWITI